MSGRSLRNSKNSPSSTTSGRINKNTARKSTSAAALKKQAARDGDSSSPSKILQNAKVSKLANECAYYLLIADQKKYPIRKADILKNVMSDDRKLFAMVIGQANKILRDTFGIKLKEVPDKKDSFILVNRHTSLDLSGLDWQDSELAQRGILYAILCAIHLAKGPLPESGLWKMLAALGVPEGTKDPLIGDIRKLLNYEWVRQLYLKREAILNSEPVEYQYSHGFRTESELDTNILAEFSQRIMQNSEPESSNAIDDNMSE